jgi:CRP-like cAMP-binding protein
MFEGLRDDEAPRLVEVARPCRCEAGEYLFRLGEAADQLYVICAGRVELTFPLSFGGGMREVPVESRGVGATVGWSALVEPHRFTLSARAAEPCDLAAFSREDLLRVCEAEPRIGLVFMRYITKVVGQRLLQVQALWVRELQRSVTESMAESST